MRILLVTNDFPPRVGGIQVYLENIYRRLAQRHEVTVLAPAYPGDVAYDAAQPFEIVRHPGPVYFPFPSIERKVKELAKTSDVVTFGAVLPMNLIGRKLKTPVAVHTHGFEVAWAKLPVAKNLLGSIGANARLVTVVSEYCRRFIAAAMPRAKRIEMLKTGVDLDAFHPGVDGAEVRKRYGLGARPVIVCVSRLVERKGQDRLIQAMPLIRKQVPDAALLLVGGGPCRKTLEAEARKLGVTQHVVFAGEVQPAQLPPHYAAGDVFAMPCRSRKAGLEVEGLGLVYLEAQACGKPAVTGDSGGAPEAVLPGRTGEVVEGRDHRALAQTLVGLLSNPEKAARMGAAGRAFVEESHHWDRVAARFQGMLEEFV